MAIIFDDKKAKDAGSWQDVFVPTYTERIRRLRENRFRTPVACIEFLRNIQVQIGLGNNLPLAPFTLINYSLRDWLFQYPCNIFNFI